MIAAGPLANVILAVICGWVSVEHGSGTWDWIGSLFWMSAVLGILSLVPMSSGSVKSDGALLWMLMRRPQQLRTWMALLAIQTEEANGVRPRDWKLLSVEQISDGGKSSREHLSCQLLLYYRALDEGLEEKALGHLEKALAGLKSVGRAFHHIVF